MDGIGIGSIITFCIGLAAVVIVGWLLLVPFKVLGKLILNGIIGGIVLILINAVGRLVNFSIGVNPLTALIVGILGVPGVLLLLLLQAIFVL